MGSKLTVTCSDKLHQGSLIFPSQFSHFLGEEKERYGKGSGKNAIFKSLGEN